MQVKENIINNGKGSLGASYLVIHETANPGATALNHVRYWQNDPTYSVHYVMDWDGIAYHCVPDNRLCWHVGNGNNYTVGIELCHATNAADFKKVYIAAVEFAAWYLKKRGWGIDRLLSHDDCRRRWGGTDHVDPITYFQKYGTSWNQFRNDVSKKMGGGNIDVTVSGGGSSVKKDPKAIHFCACTNSNGRGWLPEMWGHYDTGGSSDEFAGIPGVPIRWIAIKDVKRYRVKSLASGWLPWVSKYDTGDLEYGCAGDGSPIVALQVDDSKARYAVGIVGGGVYSDMIGLRDTGGTTDDFAGDGHNSIDRLFMNWA